MGEVATVGPDLAKLVFQAHGADAAGGVVFRRTLRRTKPTMRFVAVKSAEAQATAAIFRTRYLLVRHRTQHINAIRGQLTKHELVGRGRAHLPRLVALAEAPDHSLPKTAWTMIGVLVDMVTA